MMIIIGGLALCVWINFRTKEPSSLFSSPPPPPPPSIPIRLIYTCCVCVCVCMCAIFVVKVSHPELSPPPSLGIVLCVWCLVLFLRPLYTWWDTPNSKFNNQQQQF